MRQAVEIAFDAQFLPSLDRLDPETKTHGCTLIVSTAFAGAAGVDLVLCLVGSRTDGESDNDRTDAPATMAIDPLFFLSFRRRTQAV